MTSFPHPSLRLAPDGLSADILDQTRLPHEIVRHVLRTPEETARAIVTMQVRGAPLIGFTAACGLCFALAADPSDAALESQAEMLLHTRPTAVNLRWTLDRLRRHLAPVAPGERHAAAVAETRRMMEEDVATNQAIGRHGAALLHRLHAAPGRDPARLLHVLTHCNTGRIACMDWGTALSVIYHAHLDGLPLHVWVDETRPRGQGASLTAWELGLSGVPHTLIADSAAGHFMQRGLVDAVFVGADRVTRTGDVCNKIGTYTKALAARASGIPFHVALPCSTFDWGISDGLSEIPIEERSPDEVRLVRGVLEATGQPAAVRICPPGTPAANPAFDITPAALVTSLVTERGVFAPEELKSVQCSVFSVQS